MRKCFVSFKIMRRLCFNRYFKGWYSTRAKIWKIRDLTRLLNVLVVAEYREQQNWRKLELMKWGFRWYFHVLSSMTPFKELMMMKREKKTMKSWPTWLLEPNFPQAYSWTQHLSSILIWNLILHNFIRQ